MVISRIVSAASGVLSVTLPALAVTGSTVPAARCQALVPAIVQPLGIVTVTVVWFSSRSGCFTISSR